MIKKTLTEATRSETKTIAHYSIQVLNEGNFDKDNRINAWTAVIRTILFFDQVINKRPVYCFIDKAQQVVFRNEIIHTEHLDLFSFLVGILCHHNPKPLTEMI